MTEHPETTDNPNAAQIAALNELAKKIEAGEDQWSDTYHRAFPTTIVDWVTLSLGAVDDFIALLGDALGGEWDWSKSTVHLEHDETAAEVTVSILFFKSHTRRHKDPAIAGLLALIAAKVSELEVAHDQT